MTRRTQDLLGFFFLVGTAVLLTWMSVTGTGTPTLDDTNLTPTVSSHMHV